MGKITPHKLGLHKLLGKFNPLIKKAIDYQS